MACGSGQLKLYSSRLKPVEPLSYIPFSGDLPSYAIACPPTADYPSTCVCIPFFQSFVPFFSPNISDNPGIPSLACFKTIWDSRDWYSDFITAEPTALELHPCGQAILAQLLTWSIVCPWPTSCTLSSMTAALHSSLAPPVE